MEIISREITSSGLHRIVSQEGGAFFMRPVYLKSLSVEDFSSRNIFDEEETSDILDAGLITACECKAVDYLARSEQYRAGLLKKLLEKGYEKEFILPALDYLEKKKYLSDERYCRSWLNTRKINHAEGRTKLLAELLGRGIPRETASSALDEFFIDNNENEIAVRCYQKLIRKGKSGDKLISAMVAAGFNYKTAVSLQKNNGIFIGE